MLKALITFTRRAISVRFVSVHDDPMNHSYINPYGRVEFESLTGSKAEPTK